MSKTRNNVPRPKSAKPPKRYEYQTFSERQVGGKLLKATGSLPTLTDDGFEFLNLLGRDGWQLMNIQAQQEQSNLLSMGGGGIPAVFDIVEVLMAKETGSNQKYEYSVFFERAPQVMEIHIDTVLNKHGADGWKLLTMSLGEEMSPVANPDGTHPLNTLVAIFMQREVPE